MHKYSREEIENWMNNEMPKKRNVCIVDYNIVRQLLQQTAQQAEQIRILREGLEKIIYTGEGLKNDSTIGKETLTRADKVGKEKI